MDNLTNPLSLLNIVLVSGQLALALAAIIVGLDCIWRARRKLHTFLILLTLSLVPFALRKVAILLGYYQDPAWFQISQYTDIVFVILVFCALIEMYKIIKIVDNENNDTENQ